ncbi:hypothetical protein [Brevundimonas sp.]|uniref:hypothetical protein n=1 Tax=Brevundimonas sp. TaxID=1871086 RepID=UPI0025BBB1B9|nr:hypothetical protein [Brevundimonas sp.]
MIRTSAILAAVAFAFAAPGIASACIGPAGPPPTPEQREANLREIQAASWANAALVYEAEITESFMVFSQDDPSHPGMASGTYVRAKPVRVLKGEGAPPEVQFAYGLGPECTFGPSYSPRSRGEGSRFVFYASRPTISSQADIFSTMPVDALLDAETRVALASGR